MERDTLWSECSHDAFVGIYKDVATQEFCDSLIDFFEKNHQENSEDADKYYPSHINYGGSLTRRDFSLNLESSYDSSWGKKINSILFECLDEYKETFFVLNQVEHTSYCNAYVKMQRTRPRGGYHVWHCELNSVSCVDRCLAWILYLNDIPPGEGETEFLWQGMRIQPERGTLLIWPAQFTHTHRGNPVYSTEKYIVTGWIEYDGVRSNHPESPVIFDVEDDRAFRKNQKNDPNTPGIFFPEDLPDIDIDFGK